MISQRPMSRRRKWTVKLADSSVTFRSRKELLQHLEMLYELLWNQERMHISLSVFNADERFPHLCCFGCAVCKWTRDRAGAAR